MRGRQKQQQTGQQQADGEAYQPRSVLVTELAEQNAADNPGPAEDQQQHGGKIAAQTRHRLDEGFDIAVGGIMCGHHHHGQNVYADQRRATEQHRQALQRA